MRLKSYFTGLLMPYVLTLASGAVQMTKPGRLTLLHACAGAHGLFCVFCCWVIMESSAPAAGSTQDSAGLAGVCCASNVNLLHVISSISGPYYTAHPLLTHYRHALCVGSCWLLLLLLLTSWK